MEGHAMTQVNLSDDVVMLIAALGAKAHHTHEVQSNLDMYRNWYKEEREITSKLRDEVSRLKALLDEVEIEY
jgi:hypothetical protein